MAVLFLACATAYAFFQVPYVAMPAEITDDAGERTRLMTWRVAVLALAILVSGGPAPVIRTGIGPGRGYTVMGLFVAALIAVGALGAWRGTARAPSGRVAAAAGSLRDQLAVVAAAPDFRAVLLTFVVQALGIGAMLAGVDYLARHVPDRLPGLQPGARRRGPGPGRRRPAAGGDLPRRRRGGDRVRRGAAVPAGDAARRRR